MTQLQAPPLKPKIDPQRDFLCVSDRTSAQLHTLLDGATELKADPFAHTEILRGRTVACLFAKPSTRTRFSFATAAHRLGMLPLATRPDELQLARGETIADTARSLSGYVDAIGARVFAHRELEELAEAASVPVVNLLSDEHHPCQALADMLTLRERFGNLDGLKVAYVGVANNVSRSLAEAGALLGVDVVVAAPEGGDVTDPRLAVEGAHAIYTDAWVSMGSVSMGSDPAVEPQLDAYRVDAALFDAAASDAIFLHCLPAFRGREVTAEVIDGPRSAVWQQSANRLPTEQALLLELLA